MTKRCYMCHLNFNADNDWQDFCSVRCAIKYVCGRFTRKRFKPLLHRWREWWKDPKNKRSVHHGKPATPPEVGKFIVVERTIEPTYGRPKKMAIKVHVGGDINVKPMSLEDAEKVYKQRGREGFSENMHHGVQRELPGKNGLVGLGWFPHD